MSIFIKEAKRIIIPGTGTFLLLIFHVNLFNKYILQCFPGFSLYTKLYPSVVRDEKLNISLQDFIDDDG